MPSAFAAEFNDKGRDLLWPIHSEALTARLDGVTTSTLTGIWKRVAAEGAQAPDGALVTYTGLALFVVKVADLPDISNLAKAEIDREGETWSIRHVEPQDDWTYILHLGRRKLAMTNPKR
jgi:hypothetical protein